MTTMKPSDELFEMHKAFEGMSHEAYVCPAGVLTIGIGHTENGEGAAFPFDEKSKWTDAQIEEAWRHDMRQATDLANKLIYIPVSQGIFDASVDLMFNAGAGCKTYLTYLNNKNLEAAADALLQWIHAKDPKTGHKVALLGLIKRRFADYALFTGKASWKQISDCKLTSSNIKDFNALIRNLGYEICPDDSRKYVINKIE